MTTGASSAMLERALQHRDDQVRGFADGFLAAYGPAGPATELAW